jgi:hypothetical protein
MNYRFCKLYVQQVSRIQLLPIILSLPVQQVSPVQLLSVQALVHKFFLLTLLYFHIYLK